MKCSKSWLISINKSCSWQTWVTEPCFDFTVRIIFLQWGYMQLTNLSNRTLLWFYSQDHFFTMGLYDNDLTVKWWFYARAGTKLVFVKWNWPRKSALCHNKIGVTMGHGCQKKLLFLFHNTVTLCSHSRLLSCKKTSGGAVLQKWCSRSSGEICVYFYNKN